MTLVMYLDEDDVAGAGGLEVFRDLREQRHHLKNHQISITNPQARVCACALFI